MLSVTNPKKQPSFQAFFIDTMSGIFTLDMLTHQGRKHTDVIITVNGCIPFQAFQLFKLALIQWNGLKGKLNVAESLLILTANSVPYLCLQTKMSAVKKVY